MKRLFLLIVFLAVSVGANAAKMSSYTNNTTPNSDVYFVGVDPNDTTQTVNGSNYRYSLGNVLGSGLLSAVFSSLTVDGTGDSWLELTNNTSFTDVLTGKYGYSFLTTNPTAIINGTASRLALYSELGTDSAPTIQAADPTLASATGWYAAQTSGDIFWVNHGIEMFAIPGTRTADTIAPVIVAGADGTHDGVDAVTIAATLDELYPASPAMTFSATNADPATGSMTGTYPNYTASVTPTGTGDIVATFSAYDLTGNPATGTDLEQTFAYSGVSCLTDSVTTANDGAVIAAQTSGANAIGQSFQVATTNPISGIEFWCVNTTAGAVVELRWGTTADLSSGYETSTVTVAATDDSEWLTANFETKTAPPANTTIYFGAVLISGDISIGSHNNNPYADGTYRSASSGWNMTTSNATYDAMFRIRQCDE